MFLRNASLSSAISMSACSTAPRAVTAGAPAASTPISDLPLPDDAWISLIIRDGHPVPAHEDTILQAGDEIVVLTSGNDEASLRELFES
jgi:Trk K+ transport system NAD-binding subunit